MADTDDKITNDLIKTQAPLVAAAADQAARIERDAAQAPNPHVRAALQAEASRWRGLADRGAKALASARGIDLSASHRVPALEADPVIDSTGK